MDAAVFVSGLGALIVIAVLIIALTGPTDVAHRFDHRDRD